MRNIIRAERIAALTSSRDRIRESAKTLFAKQGYQATTTAAICRLAGTSQSQIIKHFTDKQGLLEAIFDQAWGQINPAIRLAIDKITSPVERLKIVMNMVLSFFAKDRDLGTIFLLEGRRIRGDGQMVVLVPGFLDFVKTLDRILTEMSARGEIMPTVNLQAFRSALMGAVEGMLRDQLLARTSRFPASFTDDDLHTIFSSFLSACVTRSNPQR